MGNNQSGDCPNTPYDPLHDDKESVRQTAISVLTHLAALEEDNQTFIPVDVIAVSLTAWQQTIRKRELLECLNSLRRAGYTRRVRRGTESGYRTTEKGRKQATPLALMVAETLNDMCQSGLAIRTYEAGEVFYQLSPKGLDMKAQLESTPEGQALAARLTSAPENPNSIAQATVGKSRE